MSVTTSVLRELHHIHRQVNNLTERLKRGPAQIRAGEVNCQKLSEKLDVAKKELTRLRVSADQRQLQLQEREARIAEWKTRLNQCSSNREYQTLKEQIAADEQANNVLMGEILEAFEEIDQREAAIAQVQSEAEKAQAHLEEVRARVEQEKAGIQSELDRVHANLHAAESNLPAEVKEDYFRIAKARGEDALAPIDGTTCGSCYQTLTVQTMNELYLDKPVFCKSCGALLYLPEGQEPPGKSSS